MSMYNEKFRTAQRQVEEETIDNNQRLYLNLRQKGKGKNSSYQDGNENYQLGSVM